MRCGIPPDWTDRVRQRRVDTRRMQHLLRRIRAARERRNRQLHGVSAERYDVPTHVRRALHGVGRHEVRGRDAHPRAVPRTVRHGHLLLFLQQAEGVQRAGDVRAPGLHDAAVVVASTATTAFVGCGWYYLLCRWIQDSYVHNYGAEYVYGNVWWYYRIPRGRWWGRWGCSSHNARQ